MDPSPGERTYHGSSEDGTLSEKDKSVRGIEAWAWRDFSATID